VDTGQGPAVELGIAPGDRFEDTEQKGRVAARQLAWRTVYNSLTLCQFQYAGVERLLRALNAATGWNLEPGDLLSLGMRIVALKRMLNVRRGVQIADDSLPDLLLKPLEEGGTEGRIPDLGVLLTGAYAELGWDSETGVPSTEVLEALGLGFVMGAEKG
jgi:aldehyde:ferredoxin oxidoreductase